MKKLFPFPMMLMVVIIFATIALVPPTPDTWNGRAFIAFIAVSLVFLIIYTVTGLHESTRQLEFRLLQLRFNELQSKLGELGRDIYHINDDTCYTSEKVEEMEKRQRYVITALLLMLVGVVVYWFTRRERR